MRRSLEFPAGIEQKNFISCFRELEKLLMILLAKEGYG